MKNICPRFLPVSYIFSCLLLCISASVYAGYEDDIGYTQLEFEQGGNTPDGSGISVTQVEGAQSFVGNDPVYLPDPGVFQFIGKTITVKSGSASGAYSSHASGVGTSFYGNTSSIAPGISLVDAFWENGWVQGDFLRYGGLKPKVSSSRIANHSWIYDYGSPN